MARRLQQLPVMADWIDALEDRSKAFAIASVKFAKALEGHPTIPRSVLWQFIDAATAVGANHRAARRARSKRELASKLSIVAEEADESVFWLELISGVAGEQVDGLNSLAREASQLRSIFAAGAATARAKVGDGLGHFVPVSAGDEN